MSLASGAVVATARVLVGVDDSALGPGLRAADDQVASSVGNQRTQLSRLQEAQLKAKLAQESYTKAVAKFGPDSRQAESALLRLSGAERGVAEESRAVSRAVTESNSKLSMFGVHTRNAERDLGKMGRGALAGSGLMSGLGRQVAFASGTFLGAAGFLEVTKNALSLGSDLQGQLERSRVLFGANARAIREWADRNAVSFGMSGGDALKSANDFGTMLRGFDVAPAKAATMSRSLVGLAANLAAFKRVPIEDTMNALTRGLAGQARALRLYGVSIDTTSLKAEALHLGLLKGNVDMQAVSTQQEKLAISQARLTAAQAKYGAGTTQVASAQLAVHAAQQKLDQTMQGATGTLTAGQKAMAAYSLIMHQTALEHGFFKKHSSDLYEQEQKLHAAFKTSEEQLGVALLPTVTKLTREFTNWLTKLEKTGKLQHDINAVVKTSVAVFGDVASVVRTGWKIFETAAGWIGGTKNAIEVLMGALVLNKVRKWADGMVTGLTDVKTKAVETKLAMLQADGEEAAGAEVAATATMTAWDVAMTNMKAAAMSLIGSTGIGLLVIGIGIAVVEIINHWNKIKEWIVEFGGWLKNHAYVLFAVPVIGQIAFMAIEVIKHWNDIKDVVKGIGTFFMTVFVHPIRAIEDLFSLLWQKMEKMAYSAALAIVEPFSHLPDWLGGGPFKRMKAALETKLNGMQTDAATSGTAIGQSLGANMVTAFTPFLDQISGDIAGVNPNAPGQAGGTSFSLTVNAKRLGVGSGGIYKKGGGHGGIARPGSVLDCSGYIYQVFTQSGFKDFPGTSEAQWSTMRGGNWTSQVIPEADAKPGDVVFMVGKGYPSPGHVGIVVGGSGSSAEIMQYYSSGQPADTITMSSILDLVGVKRFYLVKKPSQGGGNNGDTGGTAPPPPPGTTTLKVGTTAKHKKGTHPAVTIPQELADELAKAHATSGTYTDDIRALQRIIDWLKVRIGKTTDIKEKTKLHNLLLKEETAQQIAEGKQQALLTKERQKAVLAEINGVVPGLKAQAAALGLGQAYTVQNGITDTENVAAATEKLAIAQAKLAAAKKKYAANSVQVASAQLAVNSALDALTAAQKKQTEDKAKGISGTSGPTLVGTTQVVLDPKTGKYVLQQVKPDVDALTKYRDTILMPTLNKLQNEIVVLDKRIKTLAKHPKMHKGLLASLRAKSAALKKERTGLIGLINDITTSIGDITAALAAGIDTGQDVPDTTNVPTLTDDGSNTGGGSSGSSSSDSSSSAAAPSGPTQADIDALVEQNLSGYLGGLSSLLNSGYISNVLGAAYAGQLGAAPIPNLQGVTGSNPISMQLFFPQAPQDPHLFSQALAFELSSIMA